MKLFEIGLAILQKKKMHIMRTSRVFLGFGGGNGGGLGGHIFLTEQYVFIVLVHDLPRNIIINCFRVSSAS